MTLTGSRAVAGSLVIATLALAGCGASESERPIACRGGGAGRSSSTA